jgi:hypothetical protein
VPVPVVIQTLPQLNRDPLLDYGLEIVTKHKEYAVNALPVLVRMAKEVSGSTNVADMSARSALISAIEQISPEATSHLNY